MPFPDPDAAPSTRLERGCAAVGMGIGLVALAGALVMLGSLIAGLF